jgi:hypothetical protein
LLRLLAVNLLSGVIVAALAVGGVLLVHPTLRRLILQDDASPVALVLLAAGFIITFGSWVMGTAIMRIGRDR